MIVFKKIISLFSVVVTIFLMYFGSYLPFKKSQLLIDSMMNWQSQKIRTLQDFFDNFNKSLNFFSPVGQEESIKILGEQIFPLIQNKPPATIARALVDYLDEEFNRLPEKSSLGYNQNLLVVASTHEINWFSYKEKKDFELAQRYFLKGLEKSPKRPQFLYGLFELYRLSNLDAQAKLIGEEILKYWPEDKNVADIVASIK